MGRSKQSFQKTEKEKAKFIKRKNKEEKKEQRKSSSVKGKGLDSMMAYVDHHGNITDTPPDPKLKVELKLEDIQLGAKVEEAADPHSKLRKGRVILYKDDKGYGFIKDSITKEQIFFHLSSMVTEARQGDMVEYELGKGPKGFVALGVTKTL